MKENNKVKGFTLVELLAVIVILAIILVIAVPKVMDVIKDSKKATIESTAKMIAGSAEKAKIQNQVLGNTKEIKCEDIVKLNDIDYEACNIEFDGDKAIVTLIGSGKFKGLNVCNGTKTNASGVNVNCSEICGINEAEKIYSIVKDEPYEVNDIPSCVSVLAEKLTAVGLNSYVPMVEPLCNGETVEEYDFNFMIDSFIIEGLFTEEELVENDVIKTEEVKVCMPTKSINGVTYLSNIVKEEKAKKVLGLTEYIIIPFMNEVRFVGSNPSNYIYFNCEDKDSNNVEYGESTYNYASSCEIWRMIGVVMRMNSKKYSIKIINTASTFKSSWDSSANNVNNGKGINQWGKSVYNDGTPYEGADLMRLLNGYYIEKSGSTCRYCNGEGQETCEQVCDTNSLKNANMKPLTNIARNMIENTYWSTIAISTNRYLQEEYGITTPKEGTGCESNRGDNCNDNIERIQEWTGLVGLMYVSDIEIADGWLYNRTLPHAFTISSYYSENQAFYILNNEIVENYASANFNVWPTVYLKSDIQFVGGDGTKSSPFILK